MTKTTHNISGNVGSTLILILTLIAVSLAVILRIEATVEENCLQTLEDTVEQLGAQLSPVLVRRMQDKLWQALYFGYDYAAPFLPQLEKNLHWLDAEFAKLTEYQQKRNNTSK